MSARLAKGHGFGAGTGQDEMRRERNEPRGLEASPASPAVREWCFFNQAQRSSAHIDGSVQLKMRLLLEGVITTEAAVTVRHRSLLGTSTTNQVMYSRMAPPFSDLIQQLENCVFNSDPQLWRVST